MADESVPTEQEITEALGTEDSELGLTAEESKIVAKVLPKIAADANRRAEANKAKELQEALTVLRTENQKQLESTIEQIKKDMAPPSPEDIQTILAQEYIEFPLRVSGNGKAERMFTIRELPLEAETRIIKAVQKTLAERLTDIGRVDWSAGMTVLDRINKIIEMVPGALETLSDCVAVCLDPYGEDPAMTGEWVRRHLGANRIVGIVHAQIQAGRYRDFLSLAGKLFPNLRTI